MKLRSFLSCVVALLLACQASFASVGIFVRDNPGSITSPEANKTYCFDTSDQQLKVYDGSSWRPMVLGKLNKTATTDPGASNDSASGYSAGSIWVNTSSNKIFVCSDATTAAAVWHEITNRIQASDVLNKFSTSDAFSDYLVTGLIGSDPGSSLSMTTPAGVVYINGIRLVSSGFSNTYSASKDTYDYLQSDGTINHVEVENDDPAPSGQPGLLLQKVVTDGSEITGVTGMAQSYPNVNVATATAGQHAVPKFQADSSYSPIAVYQSGPANRVVATPDGVAGVAGQRALVNNDLPSPINIAHGGTNNASLGVTNLGIYIGNGSRIVQGPVPGGALYKWRSNASNDAIESVPDTNGTVTNFSMTAPGVIFQTPVSVSNPTSTPAAALTLRTDVAASRFIGDDGAGSWIERAIAGTDLPTLPVNKGGLGNSGLTAGAFKILYGDDSKFIEAPAAGANQSWRVNSAGTAVEVYTPEAGSGIPLGGNGTRDAPTSGTLDGVYFHDGNYSTSGTLTIKPGSRLHATGSITFSHAVTIDPLAIGGYGDTGGGENHCSPGGGLGGGNGAVGSYARNGGGGGAFGGNGGNGGSNSAGSLAFGGRKYDWKNCFVSSGGAGGISDGGSTVAGTGGNAGGTFYIESGGSITFSANVTANATAGTAGLNTFGSGGGGGAGGGIAAVAGSTITVSTGYTLSANGGNGGDAYDTVSGGGAPGGGGVIYLNAPTVTIDGAVQALAGSLPSTYSTARLPTAAEAGLTIIVQDGPVPLF